VIKGSRSQKATPSPRIKLSDIRQRWGKFDAIDLAAIKGRGDLVMQIQAKYGLDKLQAETNVDIWAKGRNF
jgi:hypothetical protein